MSKNAGGSGTGGRSTTSDSVFSNALEKQKKEYEAWISTHEKYPGEKFPIPNSTSSSTKTGKTSQTSKGTSIKGVGKAIKNLPGAVGAVAALSLGGAVVVEEVKNKKDNGA
jgi:hypothetical protein